MTERQLTVKEFCRRYGIGVTTAYKLLGEGAIMAVRYGHRTLIDVESAEAWRKSLPAFLPKAIGDERHRPRQPITRFRRAS